MRVVNCVPLVMNGSVTVMARDIGAAFQTLGAEVRELAYQPRANIPAIFPALMTWLRQGESGGLLVDINGAIVTSAPAQPIVNDRERRFQLFSFLTDAPLHFPSRFLNWPCGGLVGLIDRSFTSITQFLKFDRPEYLFFPHAGPEVSPDLVPSTERDIDFLVIGNIEKVGPPGDHAKKLFPESGLRADLFVSAFERHDPTKTPFETTRDTALEAKKGYLRKDVALVAVHLEKYINNRVRLEVLSGLEGLDVLFVGNIADELISARKSTVRQTGFTPFVECRELIGRAKVLINVRPGFPNGAHERIFYALSRGTAVLTTHSSYLAADKAEHGFVDFYDIATGDVRENALRMRQEYVRQNISLESMLNHYREHHTWARRLEPILDRAKGSGMGTVG